MKVENKYGYKICYQKENEKPKTHLVTNTYDGAKWDIDRYKNNILLRDLKWYIIPIRNYLEYSRLWRGCPFRDYLSDFIKRRKNDKVKFRSKK